MDRTTLTANLKPLERRGLIAVIVDETDRRTRRLELTEAGRIVLSVAVPIWKETHAKVEDALDPKAPDRLRVDLRSLA